tara:strand:- start:1438 stop:1611 length:174 start_codon:yes stop_codon:yes gene_type:complete
MSFARHQVSLKGSSVNGQPFKLCHRCETKKAPEGGVQTSAQRWYCAPCWVDKMKGRK